MKILAIDTATEVSSVCLWDKGLITESFNDSGILASRVTLDMLDKLFSQTDVSWHDIDLIAFGHGPGAFTGVRVATGLVQGLALGHDLPVMGISTLASIAFQAASASDLPVLAVQDARIKELYAGCYRFNEHGRLASLSEDSLCSVETLSLPESGQWLLAGNAYKEYGQQIESQIEDSELSVSVQWVPDITPRASAIAALAEQAISEGISPVSAENVVPVYLRNKVTY